MLARKYGCYVKLLRRIQFQRHSSTRPTLYYDPVAPPARFVLMTADQLGIQLDLVHVDLFHGEQYTEEYRKINPLQKIPVLKQNGILIRDSHAIALHLCGSQECSLYPGDLVSRAKIHQKLFYNSGTLFPVDSALMSEYFAGNQPLNQELLDSWRAALNYLEDNLNSHAWLSGDMMTLSDLCCAATVTSVNLLVPTDGKKHSRVNDWLRRLEDMPCHTANNEGLRLLKEKIEQFKIHVSPK